jgi:hypothetical protein
LSARFDRIFSRKSGFAKLDRLLGRQRANKNELLRVLERPDIPLHTNGSENDVRCQVEKRKISGGTRSDAGRNARDAFLGLLKTCANGILFWDYLGARLRVPQAAGTFPTSRKLSPRSRPGPPDSPGLSHSHRDLPQRPPWVRQTRSENRPFRAPSRRAAFPFQGRPETNKLANSVNAGRPRSLTMPRLLPLLVTPKRW